MVITLSGLVSIIIYLLVFAGVVTLLFYLIQILPIAEPYKGWVMLVLKVLCILVAIGFLLHFAGVPVLRIER